MRIATKLSLAAFVPALIALVIGFALVFSFRTLGEGRERSRTAKQIIRSTNNLAYLAHSYLPHSEERPVLQFTAEQAALKKLITSARFKNKDQNRLLSRIRESSDAMNRSFLRLSSSRENGGQPENATLYREAQERYVGHILVRAQDAWSDALRLESLINDEIAITQRTISTLVFLLIVIVTLPLTVLLVRLKRSVTASLAALLKGTEVVGAGDLNYRIGKAEPDEIGEISRAFDMMTERLQNTTVSRDALGREVEERKRMAAELAWLASFPENNPQPIVEVDSEGHIHYLNPASRELFPDLQERGFDHPWITDMKSAMSSLREGGTKQSVRNVVIDGVCYEQTMHYVQDAQRVRIYGTDITERVELEQAKQRLLDREHRIAETLQQALIPAQIPTTVAGCHFTAKYVPALAEARVGGDFYDVFDLGDGRVAVLIGDVAGKGVLAAMQVSAARYAFRSYAYIEPKPSRVVGLVNDALCKDHDREASMLTAFFAVVDTHSRTITYTNAGHEPPVVRRTNGSLEELNVGARALGVMPGCDYPEGSLKLEPGDTVVLVTDGITEARSEEHGMFGKPEMLRFLAEEDVPPSELVDRLLEKAREYGNGHLQDDVAVVALGLERPCAEVSCNG